MSRSLPRSVSASLIIGLLLPVATRADDGQSPAKKPAAAAAARKKDAAQPADQNRTGKNKQGIPPAPAKGVAPAKDSTAKNATAPAKNAAAARDAPAKITVAPAGKSVSFMRDVAPILVENCIACHNPRKSESKYVMTTFAQFAKGGQQGEGITIEPGEPEESNLVELIRPAGQPRMPFKQDPLPAEKIALIERWVAEGARYDGNSPGEDWTILLHKTQLVTIPAAYPVTVPITALEFSRDGSTIAASGYHEITFWKTADGTLARRLSGLAERIYDIAYSPDGKWMATASGDPGLFGVAKLWLAEPGGGGKPVRDIVETQDVVFSVAFSPNSKKIATAGADRTIRIFEVETGKLLTQIEDHADWIFAIAFSPDGKRLASASRDKTSKVFDVEKKESLVTFPAHAQPVYTVSFTPDGKGVGTGGEDNRIRIWNPDNDGKAIREIGGFGGTVFKLLYSPDGKNLLACSADKSVHVFDAKGSSLRRLQGHTDWVYALAVSRDGKTVASGSWDGEVRLWNLADGKPLRTIIAAPGYKAIAAKTAAK
ncbi:MAG: c-type cytochrome domain-containing protein [Isosphaerales bacterium]